MAGGLVFMASVSSPHLIVRILYANLLGVQNKDTVNYLDRTNADPMFILTVIIGITALVMSWITGVMAIKGWALRREQS